MSAFQTAKHLLAPLTANCRDFHEHWRDAVDPPDPHSVSGRWHGEWVSSVTGHRGPLRCVMIAVREDRWKARFHASYSRVFRACYVTELHATRLGPNRFALRGSNDLGWMAGGVYEYDGEASGAELMCRYKSGFDNGEFRLRRGRQPGDSQSS
jgi:hypothetical protein